MATVIWTFSDIPDVSSTSTAHLRKNKKGLAYIYDRTVNRQILIDLHKI